MWRRVEGSGARLWLTCRRLMEVARKLKGDPRVNFTFPMADSPGAAVALTVAQAWLSDKGWDPNFYSLNVSAVQSCPEGLAH